MSMAMAAITIERPLIDVCPRVWLHPTVPEMLKPIHHAFDALAAIACRPRTELIRGSLDRVRVR